MKHLTHKLFKDSINYTEGELTTSTTVDKTPSSKEGMSSSSILQDNEKALDSCVSYGLGRVVLQTESLNKNFLSEVSDLYGKSGAFEQSQKQYSEHLKKNFSSLEVPYKIDSSFMNSFYNNYQFERKTISPIKYTYNTLFCELAFEFSLDSINIVTDEKTQPFIVSVFIADTEKHEIISDIVTYDATDYRKCTENGLQVNECYNTFINLKDKIEVEKTRKSSTVGKRKTGFFGFITKNKEKQVTDFTAFMKITDNKNTNLSHLQNKVKNKKKNQFTLIKPLTRTEKCVFLLPKLMTEDLSKIFLCFDVKLIEQGDLDKTNIYNREKITSAWKEKEIIEKLHPVNQSCFFGFVNLFDDESLCIREGSFECENVFFTKTSNNKSKMFDMLDGASQLNTSSINRKYCLSNNISVNYNVKEIKINNLYKNPLTLINHKALKNIPEIRRKERLIVSIERMICNKYRNLGFYLKLVSKFRDKNGEMVHCGCVHCVNNHELFSSFDWHNNKLETINEFYLNFSENCPVISNITHYDENPKYKSEIYIEVGALNFKTSKLKSKQQIVEHIGNSKIYIIKENRFIPYNFGDLNIIDLINGNSTKNNHKIGEVVYSLKMDSCTFPSLENIQNELPLDIDMDFVSLFKYKLSKLSTLEDCAALIGEFEDDLIRKFFQIHTLLLYLLLDNESTSKHILLYTLALIYNKIDSLELGVYIEYYIFNLCPVKVGVFDYLLNPTVDLLEQNYNKHNVLYLILKAIPYIFKLIVSQQIKQSHLQGCNTQLMSKLSKIIFTEVINKSKKFPLLDIEGFIKAAGNLLLHLSLLNDIEKFNNLTEAFLNGYFNLGEVTTTCQASLILLFDSFYETSIFIETEKLHKIKAFEGQIEFHNLIEGRNKLIYSFFEIFVDIILNNCTSLSAKRVCNFFFKLLGRYINSKELEAFCNTFLLLVLVILENNLNFTYMEKSYRRGVYLSILLILDNCSKALFEGFVKKISIKLKSKLVILIQKINNELISMKYECFTSSSDIVKSSQNTISNSINTFRQRMKNKRNQKKELNNQSMGSIYFQLINNKYEPISYGTHKTNTLMKTILQKSAEVSTSKTENSISARSRTYNLTGDTIKENKAEQLATLKEGLNTIKRRRNKTSKKPINNTSSEATNINTLSPDEQYLNTFKDNILTEKMVGNSILGILNRIINDSLFTVKKEEKTTSSEDVKREIFISLFIQLINYLEFSLMNGIVEIVKNKNLMISSFTGIESNPENIEYTKKDHIVNDFEKSIYLVLYNIHIINKLLSKVNAKKIRMKVYCITDVRVINTIKFITLIFNIITSFDERVIESKTEFLTATVYNLLVFLLNTSSRDEKVEIIEYILIKSVFNIYNKLEVSNIKKLIHFVGNTLKYVDQNVFEIAEKSLNILKGILSKLNELLELITSIKSFDRDSDIGDKEEHEELLACVLNFLSEKSDMKCDWLKLISDYHVKEKNWSEASLCELKRSYYLSLLDSSKYKREEIKSLQLATEYLKEGGYYLPAVTVLNKVINYNQEKGFIEKLHKNYQQLLELTKIWKESVDSTGLLSIDNSLNNRSFNILEFPGVKNETELTKGHIKKKIIVKDDISIDDIDGEELEKEKSPLKKLETVETLHANICKEIGYYYFSQTLNPLGSIFYKVMFYISKKEEPLEYVYKADRTISSAQFSSWIKKMTENKFDKEVKIVGMMNKEPELGDKQVVVSIVKVEPIIYANTNNDSDTDKELMIDILEEIKRDKRVSSTNKFFYSMPFTQSGKSYGEITEQYKKTIIVYTEESFPSIKTRLRIRGSKEEILDPLRNIMEDICKKNEQILNSINKKETDSNEISQLLVGSLLTQVNVGVLAVFEEFVEKGANKYKEQELDKLKRLLVLFLSICEKALDIYRDNHQTSAEVVEELESRLAYLNKRMKKQFKRRTIHHT